jgi:3-methyladenine DNA glycosylase/8-oxoguanine DNA glycosylase
VKGLPARSAAEEMAAIAAPWRPWRAAAARLCWHYYLSRMVTKSSRGNGNGSIKTDPAN